MNVIRKIALVLCVLCVLLILPKRDVRAEETSAQVQVMVPSNIEIVFQSDGTNTVEPFIIHNQSLVPIQVERVLFTECNDWKLVGQEEHIPVNTKQLSLMLEQHVLQAGENEIDVALDAGETKTLSLDVKRGAWTQDQASETALQAEVEYQIGTKEFQLQFDTNGSEEYIATKNVCNGTTITLPTPYRTKHDFLGWQGEDGVLYTGEFVMPIGDVTLTAQWVETTAYAIYSETDHTFRFVRSAEPIVKGEVYEGYEVTEVYTNLESAIQTRLLGTDIQWRDIRPDVHKIIVEDEVFPVETRYWFCYMTNCSFVDVTKMNTSQLTDMGYMFRHLGYNAPTVTILGMDDWDVSNVVNMEDAFCLVGGETASYVNLGDLSKWDTSNVTDMDTTFRNTARGAKTFVVGDLSNWDTSNVVDMRYMFIYAGANADWYLNCSKWNVNKVTSYKSFNYGVETKVKPPVWVN